MKNLDDEFGEERRNMIAVEELQRTRRDIGVVVGGMAVIVVDEAIRIAVERGASRAAAVLVAAANVSAAAQNTLHRVGVETVRQLRVDLHIVGAAL